jgi:hypothetical protein
MRRQGLTDGCSRSPRTESGVVRRPWPLRPARTAASARDPAGARRGGPSPVGLGARDQAKVKPAGRATQRCRYLEAPRERLLGAVIRRGATVNDELEAQDQLGIGVEKAAEHVVAEGRKVPLDGAMTNGLEVQQQGSRPLDNPTSFKETNARRLPLAHGGSRTAHPPWLGSCVRVSSRMREGSF